VLDSTLKDAVETAQKKIAYQTEQLQQKIGRALDHKQNVLAAHEQFLSNLLYPDKSLQSANCVSCPSPLAGASRVSKKSSATPGSKTSARTSLFPPRNISTAMKTLRVKTSRRTQFVDITREVEQAVSESGVKSGVGHVYVPHTTAGVSINEHADPTSPATSKEFSIG